MSEQEIASLLLGAMRIVWGVLALYGLSLALRGKFKFSGLRDSMRRNRINGRLDLSAQEREQRSGLKIWKFLDALFVLIIVTAVPGMWTGVVAAAGIVLLEAMIVQDGRLDQSYFQRQVEYEREREDADRG